MFGYLKYLFGSMIVAAALVGIVWLIAWRVFDLRLYSVQSDSMSPVFRRGDLLVDIRPSGLKAGDVVTYESPWHPGELISHRITSIKSDAISTKGDALSSADPDVRLDAVQGRAVAALPKAGYIFDELHKPAGLIALVYLPALLITIRELWLLTGQYKYRFYRFT